MCHQRVARYQTRASPRRRVNLAGVLAFQGTQAEASKAAGGWSEHHVLPSHCLWRMGEVDALVSPCVISVRESQPFQGAHTNGCVEVYEFQLRLSQDVPATCRVPISRLTYRKNFTFSFSVLVLNFSEQYFTYILHLQCVLISEVIHAPGDKFKKHKKA